MRFALWLKDSGPGCDYTVGCGNALFPLNAETAEGAADEAKGVLLERTHVRLQEHTDQPDGDSRIFRQAILVSVVSDMTVIAEAVGEKKRREKLKERVAEKRAQLAKLKSEVGGDSAAVRALQDEREDQIDKMIVELTELLRQNGHKIDDSDDYALMMNVARRHFDGERP